MVRDHLLLGFLWILYGVLHSVFARQSVKDRARKWLGSRFRFYRFGYVLFAFFFLAALVLYALGLNTPTLLPPSSLRSGAGWILGCAGLLLMLLCIRKYFLSLSGLRSLVREEVPGELMITGIHRYVRHPLYLGTFAFLWGWFLIRPVLSLFLSNLVITVYTVVALEWEEQKLVSEFGSAYREYRRRVPSLFPRLSFRRKPRTQPTPE